MGCHVTEAIVFKHSFALLFQDLLLTNSVGNVTYRAEYPARPPAVDDLGV